MSRRVPPVAVECWILHVIHGHSMRKIARVRGVHASTVLRRVRRVEDLCDDPAAEQALTELAARRAIALDQGPCLDWPDLERTPA